jgi:hypothetical protein
MTDKIRILFLSANPWTTSRILVDEEAREIFEKLQEGTHRDMFELHKHTAIRPIDLQRLLMMYEPHIVHFSGHGSKTQKIILGGTPGRGKEVDSQGLVEVFALYKNHLRLVLLNACFTRAQACSLSEVIDYSVGTGKGMGDKGGVAFAGAFYRALGFGKSVKEAFESAKAELGLTRMPRTRGIELFVRNGISESDAFPQTDDNRNSKVGEPSTLFAKDLFASHSSQCETRRRGCILLHQDIASVQTEERSESQSVTTESFSISRPVKPSRSDLECDTNLEPVADFSSIQSRPGSYEFGLMFRRGEVSLPDLKRSTHVKKADSGPTKDEAESRLAELYSHVYVAIMVNFRRAPLTNATDLSPPHTAAQNDSIVPAMHELVMARIEILKFRVAEMCAGASCCKRNKTNEFCASSIPSEGPQQLHIFVEG